MDDEDDGKPFTLCPSCQRKVEPGAEGVHYAVQIVKVDGFGGTDYLDGIGGFLHEGCAVPRGWTARPKSPLR